MIAALLHRLAHLFALNYGEVVTAYRDGGKLWIGVRCCGCGEVSGAHPSVTNRT